MVQDGARWLGGVARGIWGDGAGEIMVCGARTGGVMTGCGCTGAGAQGGRRELVCRRVLLVLSCCCSDC